MRRLLARAFHLAGPDRTHGAIDPRCMTANDFDHGLIREAHTALGSWGGLDTDDPAARIRTHTCPLALAASARSARAEAHSRRSTSSVRTGR